MLMTDSRPRVSNDTSYSEALFRSHQILPGMAHKKLRITECGKGMNANVRAGLHEQHLHSGITQPDRYRGLDRERLQYRKAVYESAKHQRPQYWLSLTQTGRQSTQYRSKWEKCTKSSLINRLLKCSHLENWVENHH